MPLDATPPPLALLPVSDVDPSFVDHVLRASTRIRPQKEAVVQRQDPGHEHAQRWLDFEATITREDVEALMAQLGATGPVSRPEKFNQYTLVLTDVILEIAVGAAATFPGLTLRQAIRLLALRDVSSIYRPSLYRIAYICSIDTDLRAVAAALDEATGTKGEDSITHNMGTRFHPDHIDPDYIWPYFADNPETLERGLSIGQFEGARYDVNSVAPVLRILALFPQVPNAYVPHLEQIALGDGIRNRIEAQDLLANHGALDLALSGLRASSAKVRSSSARWLVRILAADRADRESLRTQVTSALGHAVADESEEEVQAALLGSLRSLGADLSSFLTPSVLESAARTGLAKPAPAGMEWVPLGDFPALCWADGSAVEPVIVQWWATLAIKLKDPAGEGLIPLYVSLLDDASQRALGSYVLQIWVTHDLLKMSDAEARVQAVAEAPAKLAQYKAWAAHYGTPGTIANAAMSIAEVENEIIRDLQGNFLGSSLSEKGLLALTSGAPGHEITAAIARYSKKHPERRHQAENLVIAASTNDDPAALQTVISIARSYKQKSIRARAAELVEQIAAKRGWTTDELADRTIPTAGFPTAEDAADEDLTAAVATGIAVLDYGARQFTMRIGDDLTLALFTADDKPLKALPAPGVKDDEALAKAARSTASTAKKELAQVVTHQSSRLQEAMALGRVWSAEVWQSSFIDHPVMRHLVSRLVWVTGPTGEDGEPLHTIDGEEAGSTLFSPTIDGELLDASDDVIALDPDASIWLAHVSRLRPETATVWQARQSDFGITPLFTQVTGAQPEIAAGATQSADREGWVLTIGALKSRTTKQGFRLAPTEDGAWVTALLKDLGPWTLTVETTGTYPGAPAKEVLALLSFSVGRSGRAVPLDQVPPVLLTVFYNDYLALADGGVFDPEWMSRTEWAG